MSEQPELALVDPLDQLWCPLSLIAWILSESRDKLVHIKFFVGQSEILQCVKLTTAGDSNGSWKKQKAGSCPAIQHYQVPPQYFHLSGGRGKV